MSVSKEEWDRLKYEEMYGMVAKLMAHTELNSQMISSLQDQIDIINRRER